MNAKFPPFLPMAPCASRCCSRACWAIRSMVSTLRRPRPRGSAPSSIRAGSIRHWLSRGRHRPKAWRLAVSAPADLAVLDLFEGNEYDGGTHSRMRASSGRSRLNGSSSTARALAAHRYPTLRAWSFAEWRRRHGEAMIIAEGETAAALRRKLIDMGGQDGGASGASRREREAASGGPRAGWGDGSRRRGSSPAAP